MSSAPARASSGVVVAPPVPVGRRVVLSAVRRFGEATVGDIADDLGITISGARQHLASLAGHGLVEATELERAAGQRGRPRLKYHVTELGDTLFPKAYGALANELLGFVAEDDPSAVERLFQRRRDHRIEVAAARLSRHRSLPAKIAELAAILDEDGYMASWQQLDPHRYLLVEHNCAITDVAGRYRQACVSELEFIRAVLPAASVERVEHLVSGGRRCAYEIRRSGGSGRRS